MSLRCQHDVYCYGANTWLHIPNSRAKFIKITSKMCDSVASVDSSPIHAYFHGVGLISPLLNFHSTDVVLPIKLLNLITSPRLSETIAYLILCTGNLVIYSPGGIPLGIQGSIIGLSEAPHAMLIHWVVKNSSQYRHGSCSMPLDRRQFSF